MGTAGMFAKSEHEELNRITSKSILEKLMNIRQKIDVGFTARRLIWELMQNAKDNVNLCNVSEAKVDIEISLNEDTFVFSHNNGYFTSGHIRGLVRKYSSGDKERNTEQLGQTYKTTGRFGTGFMTTHLLSEKVQVNGVFQHDETSLFHPFGFNLDRTGKTEAKIVEGMNNAFEQAETSINKTDGVLEFETDFKTSFTYMLSDQKKTLAAVALEETMKGIAYTLINVPEINSVTIDHYSEKTNYSVIETEVPNIIGNDEQFVYNLLINKKKSDQYFLAVQGDEVRIIIPITCKKGRYDIIALEDGIPRLHLDFPMIGTENLHLPFVVNSTLFEPTEPRDGVSLIDDEDNEFTQLNCRLMDKAVALYNMFLGYVGENSNWHELYNLARIKKPGKHPWIDQTWYKNNVIDDIRKILLHIPLVDVTSGERVAIWNEADEMQVYFPDAIKPDIRKGIWKLAKKIYPGSIPMESHIDQWYDIIWSDCCHFSISSLSDEIHKAETIGGLANILGEGEADAIDFLNEYYILLNSEDDYINEVNNDKVAVIPNQLGIFKVKSELLLDQDIDDELKNASAIIMADPRSYLLFKEAYTGDGIRYTVKKQDDVIADLNKALKANDHENISLVCDYLASLFPDGDISQRRIGIYEYSQRVFPEDFTNKRRLASYDERIWDESDKKSLFYIVSEIAEEKTVENVTKSLKFESKAQALNWLNKFVGFLIDEGFENNINREKYPILPNQNGDLRRKEDLFLDSGDIDDKLKTISANLGHDFREDLLDTAIFLELPENRTYDITDVAEKISSHMKPILRDVDRRKEHSDTLKEFYLWMNENRDDAAEHFSDLYEKRFLFLEDDDISFNMKKATEFDAVMEEHGIGSIEELRAQLSLLKSINTGHGSTDGRLERILLTQETLASLGITSPAEFDKAFEDPLIQSRFYHISKPTKKMYDYAQQLIERARNNIRAYLESHDDYDCTDIEEMADTVLGGIVKNGVIINVVARPSDNGEVIFYYSSEKDTLDTDTAELWVDNGHDDPHLLTLGRILKSTGINRIPIKMN